ASTPAPFTPGTAASGQLPALAASPPPPPPPPPNVVVGNPNGGATFGGVSGCNSQVCSDEFKGAMAMIGAERAFQQRAQGGSDQEILDRTAREAVQKLVEAADARRRVVGADSIEAGVVLKDYGEMGRVSALARQRMEQLVNSGQPMEALETANELKAM